MDRINEENYKDFASSSVAAEFFLSKPEREKLNAFRQSVFESIKKLSTDNKGDFSIEINNQAVDVATQKDPEGRKVFDKWIDMSFSAMEPKNKPNNG